MSNSYLSSYEIDQHADIIRDSSIDLLIKDWKIIRDREANSWTWGDEIEYQLITLDERERKAYLALKQDEILRRNDKEVEANAEFEFQPEYTKYQVESIPEAPYSSMKDLLTIETSMKRRRHDLKRRLGSDADPFTLSMFPLLGDKQTFTIPALPLTSKNVTSSSIPDEIISAKERYQTLEINTRERGGRPAEIRIPIFRDRNTPWPYLDPEMNDNTRTKTDNNIHMDGLIFGPGACGLQVTLQTLNLSEARNLHDQFCALGPIMMALTASTPIYKGRLADVDARWQALCASLEDRKASEHSKLPTRWSISPMYIGTRTACHIKLGPYAPDAEVVERLKAGGFDESLAQYFGSLLLRNPILLTKADISPSPEDEKTDLDTRFGTSSWPHIRLKLPAASNPEHGWRLEFRTMEVQPTDYWNAAAATFVVLLRHAMMQSNCDFCVSPARLEENMNRAQARDAVRTQKFWWRLSDGSEEKLTLHQIVNGLDESRRDASSPLRDLAEDCVSKSDLTSSERDKVRDYINLICHRADGSEDTPAMWMRKFIASHENYRHDSVVTPDICYDMLRSISAMNEG